MNLTKSWLVGSYCALQCNLVYARSAYGCSAYVVHARLTHASTLTRHTRRQLCVSLLLPACFLCSDPPASAGGRGEGGAAAPGTAAPLHIQRTQQHPLASLGGAD